MCKWTYSVYNTTHDLAKSNIHKDTKYTSYPQLNDLFLKFQDPQFFLFFNLENKWTFQLIFSDQHNNNNNK